MSQPERSNRFSTPNTIELALSDASVAERIAAVKELLRVINAANDVDAHAVYEDGVVTVEVPLGLREDKWRVAFHLVWPEPALNNQHLNTVKLMNWSAVFKLDFLTAGLARKQGLQRLRKLIEKAIATGSGPLGGRLRFIEHRE